MINPKQSAVQRILGKPAEANGGAGTESKAAPPQGASAVQRYLGNGAADGTTPLTTEEMIQRKSYCILRGRLPLPPMFRLINRQGRWRSFDYASLTGASMDSPQTLLLHYDGRESYTLTISGLDLDQELADAFDDRRVLWVQELDELDAADIRNKDKDMPVVTKIGIEMRLVSRTWDGEPGSRQTGLPSSRGRQ